MSGLNPSQLLAGSGYNLNDDKIDARDILSRVVQSADLRRAVLGQSLVECCHAEVLFYFSERVYRRHPSKRLAVFLWERFIPARAPLAVNVQDKARIAMDGPMALILQNLHYSRSTSSRLKRLVSPSKNLSRVPPHTLFDPILKALFNEAPYFSLTGGAFDDFFGRFICLSSVGKPINSKIEKQVEQYGRDAAKVGLKASDLGLA